jgi:hypothetical protein
MNTSFTKDTILCHLKELDRKDPGRSLFGANGHHYRLSPPLQISEIHKVEKRHRITLPEDYKYFITEIGNGGAGPYYGVFPFGEQDDVRDFCKWEDGCLVGDLAKPFPHNNAWNLPESFWRNMPDPGPETPLEEEDQMMEAWDKELERNYWHPEIMNGAIPICHIGCARREWLVVNGHQKGYVWGDDRADNTGIFPVCDDKGKRLTFSDWYLGWLTNPQKAMGIK